MSKPSANQMNDVLNRSIKDLDLSVRSYNGIRSANIHTISELVHKSESEMLRIKSFGRVSLNEIREVLSGLGLSFGMQARGTPISNKEPME
jgi:DNA-directed RNA polymerase subunit alpha